MKKITLLRNLVMASCCLVGGFSAKAQFSFANSNSLITTATHSGCAVTVVDVNNDGLDDMLIMDQSTTLVLELQNQNGSYTRTSLGTITTGGGRVWGMAAADIDKNGWKDVITGTNGNLYLVKLFSSGGVVTATTTAMSGNYFVQNVTFGDFNNDGWIDVSVCDDVDYSRTYMNDGAGNLPILAHSVTSLTIGTGAQTLTVQTGLNFTAGQTVLVGVNASNYMTGTVTSYTTGSGALVVNVTSVVGSGTYATWSVHPNVVFNININGTLAQGTDPDDSGNYGSVWVDFDNDGDLDFYIAHCRQSANSATDVRRRDRLFINDGAGHFTEDAPSYNIESTSGNYKQTWTTSFGDIDNDGDFDIVMTNHGENGQVLQNDGTGHYTDITATSGFNTTTTAIPGGMDPIESTVEDFDNDGFVDILVTGGGGGDSYVMYHNNGNSTFTLVTAPFPSTTNGMLSFATGDLNHDGKMDVFVSYGNVYNTPTTTADVLYLNTTNNTNHFITFNLTGTATEVDAIGARVTIYGPWGKQIREVRAGDAYGTSNSMQLHFGLGSATTVDSARIDWPSHSTPNHFTNLAADQFVTVVEGGCTLAGNTSLGSSYTLCSAQTQLLTAPAGYTSYSWTTGATTQAITVTGANAGSVSVLVTNAAGCSNISPATQIILNPTGTPTVTATGPVSPCVGDITLTSSNSGTTFSWSGPSGFTAATQSINPPESGAYTVTTSGGVCGTVASAPYSVTMLAAPTPTVTGASSATAAALNLSATGAGTISWYDQATGGTLLTTGTSYTTPVISTTTTYYVEQATTYPGVSGHTGEMYHTGASLYNNTINGGIDFNVLATATLVSVKVYTDSTHHGTRQIIINNSSGTLVDSMTVNITADTTVVTLNLPLAIGNGYRITTNATLDNTNFAAGSPFFQRSTAGVVYPYAINGLVSLTNGWTGSNTSGTAYYYFYDWVVQGASTVCTSPRIPVTATIGTSVGINSITNNNGIEVYPNPASEEVNVMFENNAGSNATVELNDVTGRLVGYWSIDKPMQGQKIKLNVNSINAGTYFITIKTDTKKVVQKLVLTK